MAIRDYFKKAPDAELERKKSLRDPEQILAWLEELGRLGTAMEMEFGESDLLPIPGKVGKIDETAGTVALLCRWKPTKEPIRGHPVRVVFPLDNHRFKTELAYQGRGNYLEYRCSLPTAMFHAERRDSVRVKMRPRDDLSIIVLQGLFEGLGLSGTLVDLSLTGCSFLIKRAIQVKDERRLPITESLSAVGTPLALVRLTNLPHLPMVECGGTLCSIRHGVDGVIVGLRFEGLGAPETGILGKFLSGRNPNLTFDFPHKRRVRDLTEAELLLPQAIEAPAVADEPSGEADPQAEQAPAEEAPPDPESHEALTDQDRLNLVRKRGKKILLVMGDELDRILIMAMLHQDGYRCLFEARTLVQALDQQRRLPLDLVMVDQTVGHLHALELVELLRDKGLPGATPVVVMKRTVDHKLTLGLKGGKVNLLVDRPLDFVGTLKPALESLLGLGVSP